MADRRSAEIAIGGSIPSHLVPELISLLQAEGICLTGDEERFTPCKAEDLLESACANGNPGPLRLLDHEVAEGRFADLEAFLVEHRLAFERWSAGSREADPELVRFRPGMFRPIRYPATSTKKPLVEMAPVAEALRAIRRGENERAVLLLDRVLGPGVEPLGPLTFPQEPPPAQPEIAPHPRFGGTHAHLPRDHRQ